MSGYNSSGGWGGSTHDSDTTNHLPRIPQVTSPGAIERLRAGGEVCGCDPGLIERCVPDDLRGRLEFSRRWMCGTLWFVGHLS